ncbi:MAG: hypothetical protein KDH94_07600 [Coxiellaceae bacterium]|nr:hypothetical protein [Coxiellaceae bacterium]
MVNYLQLTALNDLTNITFIPGSAIVVSNEQECLVINTNDVRDVNSVTIPDGNKIQAVVVDAYGRLLIQWREKLSFSIHRIPLSATTLDISEIVFKLRAYTLVDLKTRVCLIPRNQQGNDHDALIQLLRKMLPNKMTVTTASKDSDYIVITPHYSCSNTEIMSLLTAINHRQVTTWGQNPAVSLANINCQAHELDYFCHHASNVGALHTIPSGLMTPAHLLALFKNNPQLNKLSFDQEAIIPCDFRYRPNLFSHTANNHMINIYCKDIAHCKEFDQMIALIAKLSPSSQIEKPSVYRVTIGNIPIGDIKGLTNLLAMLSQTRLERTPSMNTLARNKSRTGFTLARGRSSQEQQAHSADTSGNNTPERPKRTVTASYTKMN